MKRVLATLSCWSLSLYVSVCCTINFVTLSLFFTFYIKEPKILSVTTFTQLADSLCLKQNNLFKLTNLVKYDPK